MSRDEPASSPQEQPDRPRPRGPIRLRVVDVTSTPDAPLAAVLRENA